MSKKYNTDELVNKLEWMREEGSEHWLLDSEINAIIAKLRAWDKLCGAAEHTDIKDCLKFLERINEDGEMRDEQGLLLFPLTQIRNLLRKALPDGGKK